MQRAAFAALGLTTMLVLSAGSAAFAASNYDPQNNTTVNVNLPVSLPNLGTGALTVGLQETVQNLVQGVTGTSIGYDFIMVDVNNQNVAGIDPFTFYSD